jgi:hypothetical protein
MKSWWKIIASLSVKYSWLTCKHLGLPNISKELFSVAA